jgi:hypothetical protein
MSSVDDGIAWPRVGFASSGERREGIGQRACGTNHRLPRRRRRWLVAGVSESIGHAVGWLSTEKRFRRMVTQDVDLEVPWIRRPRCDGRRCGVPYVRCGRRVLQRRAPPTLSCVWCSGRARRHPRVCCALHFGGRLSGSRAVRGVYRVRGSGDGLGEAR